MKIFIDRPITSDNTTIVIRDDFWDHYVTTVRRKREGDRLEVAGQETVAEGTIEASDPLTISVQQTRPANLPDYQLNLCQAITRKQKFDDVIKRGADVGITDFYPLISERTVREPNKPEKQRKRWRRMALDSARISDRDWCSRIHPINSLEGVIEDFYGNKNAFLGDPGGISPGKVLSKPMDEVVLFVGPEGGFNDEEKQRMQEFTRTLSLGEYNYQAETASLILSTIWLHEQEKI